ncbi:MAG TPA: carboxypeptidase-like regulatory domain-containing protein, partial [Candidatus Andersenbacteria bacterium]|nr:carboxypeptidase-like regulatory domain-containing protein [Candidatus Andersenbacteria bacterium]
EVWGAGGGGGGSVSNGGGGGGGAYSIKTITVVPGNGYTVNVGAGGAGAIPNGTAGGTSWFSSSSTVAAEGGSGAVSDTSAAGGLAANGYGDTKYSGGSGSTGSIPIPSDAGYGGGSSAGTGSNGTNGSAMTGGTAPTGGGNGGNGGSETGIAGSNGTAPGGGGGGGGTSATPGSGAAGKVTITYNAASTVSVAGTVYSDEGTTPLTSKTIAISINGAASAGTAVSNGAGVYTITDLTISAGDILTLYIDGASEDAVTVTVGTGSNMTGVDLYQNRLITRHDNSGSLTNSNLNTSDNNGDADITAIYSISGSALTVVSGKELIIPASHTFAPGGDVTTPAFDLRGTYTASSNTLTVSGDFTNTGGTFTAGDGTVVFNGTNQTISGNTTFHNFKKTEGENNGSDETLTFTTGSTQTITGKWTLNGTDGNDRINLVSSSPGTQWNVDTQGTRTIDYIEVTDSKNTNQTAISCLNNCVDGGNTTKWVFPSPPELVSFTSSTIDGTYGPGDTINITATYNEALDDPSTITVTLDNGVILELNSISGSTIYGTYTVGSFGSGEDTSDLTITSISSESVRDVDGGSIQTESSLPDAADNIAATSALVINTIAPSTSGTPAPTDPVIIGTAVDVPLPTITDSGSESATENEPVIENVVESSVSENSAIPNPIPSLIENVSIPKNRETLRSIIDSRVFQVVNRVLATFALGSVVLLSSTFISNIPTLLFQMSQAFQRMWQGLLAVIGFNRVKRPWGRVLDADSGNPLAGAYIQVYDHQAKQLKETMVSNERGAFSVMIPPGTYEFRVQKPGWVLTPKASFLQLVAGEHVFDGTPVVVTQAQLLPLVIAMRVSEAVPTTNHLILRRISQGVVLFIARLSWPLLIFGIGLNSTVLFITPTSINIGIEILYVVLIVWKITLHFLLKPSVGYVRDAVTNKPLDLAFVRLYDAMTSRLIETRTTSHDGKFLLLPPLGVYTIMVVRSGYESYRESHVVVSKTKESLDLSFNLQPTALVAQGSEVPQ